MRWNDRPHPFTGFGDEPNLSIKFMVMRERGERNPNWTGGAPKLSTHRIHNSSDVVTQYHGREEREITLRLWFANLDDLELLDAVQGRRATLRYRYGITTNAGGTKETRGDVPYLVLPDTLLVRLEDQRTPPGGYPEAVATFRRAVGDASYYGYAVASEG